MRKTVLLLLLLTLLVLPPISREPALSAPIEPRESYRQEIEELARQGDGEALYALALLLDLGSGLPEDRQRAIALYRQAAAKNIAGACLYLGMKYEFGNGVPRDLRRAAELYEKAAMAGWPMAQFFLGNLYLRGIDGVPDPARALSWLTRAAEAGYPGAAEQAERAAGLLSGQQPVDPVQAPDQHLR